MFGVIQECSWRPKHLPKGNKKNESGYVELPGHRPNYGETLELVKKEKTFAKYHKHGEKMMLEKEFNKRFVKKLEEYDEWVDARREKLRDLLWKEERELYMEVVGTAQTVREEKFQEMKIQIQEVKNREELERKEVAHEKRVQQYLEKCEEFRPVVAHRRLKESKEAQVAQMKDNQMRKSEEKQTENFWHEVLLNNVREANEREDEKERERKRQQEIDKEIWASQCNYREIEKQNALHETRQDLIEMNNLKEKYVKEQIEKLHERMRKKEEYCKDIATQIKKKQEELKKEEENEKIFIRTWQDSLEVENLEEKRLRRAARLKQEMDQYMDYLTRLEKERKAEQKRIEELVEKELVEVQKREDETKCKLLQAKENLMKVVEKENQEQIDYRRQEAEQQLKMKQTENEFIRIAHDQNERLRAEYARQKYIAEQQYREDLKKQIEYKKLEKEREQEELNRLVAAGVAEEEKYMKDLHKIFNSEVKVSEVHPFKKVFEKKLDYNKFF